MDALRVLFAPDEARDMLRKLGGLLLGIGMLLIFVRKSEPALGETWGDFGLFVVLLLPCLFLYAVGFLGRQSTRELRPWESVYLVFALIFVPLVLFQLIELVNGDTGASLNVFWIFLVTAGLAALAAFLAGVRYQLFLGSVALIVSWSALWDEILTDGLAGDLGTYRGLLIILAALLLGAALAVYLLDRDAELARPSELVTGAGLSAVTAAGGISLTTIFSEATVVLLPTARPSNFWNGVLLIVALLLVLYGARFRVRGPSYVGAIGLFLVILIVGLDLPEMRGNNIVGWPLAALVAGAIAFGLSLIPGLKVDVTMGQRGSGPGPPRGSSGAGQPGGAPETEVLG